LYCLRYPSKSGRWLLNAPIRCDWWIAHQLQLVYAALPFLEALLRLVPGLYSVWLRLWGSSIGKRVYWTPLVEILDRHMLSVGDDVVFGHQVCCTSHIIRKKTNGDLVLMVRPTRIEAGVLIGARARIGPGVKIPAKSVVPYNAEYRFAYAE
jgi:acetyltransferase-like isoleucine patch superfamily enzyme